MQLHAFKPTHAGRRIKRIGRGGKRGAYSGRGIKGQKARAGRRIRPAIRDFLKKLPKRRGYRFNTLNIKPCALNISVLERHFTSGDTISTKTLIQKRVLRTARGLVPLVKILGGGILTKAFIIEKIPLSKSARQKIEAVGGKIVTSA